MTAKNYILIIAPPNELPDRVNERWDEYKLFGAPFVRGGSICQAMVRRDDEPAEQVYQAVVGQASSVVYNVEAVNE